MTCDDGGMFCFASDTLAKNNRQAIVDGCDLRRVAYRHRASHGSAENRYPVRGFREHIFYTLGYVRKAFW